MNNKKLIVSIICGVVVLGLLELWWSWANLAATKMGRFFAGAGIATSLVLLLVVIIAVAWFLYWNASDIKDNREYTNSRYHDSTEAHEAHKSNVDRSALIQRIIATVLVVGFVPYLYLGVIQPLNRWDHDSMHALVKDVKTVTSEAPGYAPRMPYPTAVARITRGLGSLRANPGNYTYIPQTGQWCAILTLNNWRRPLQGVACTTEAGVVTVKQFAHLTPAPTAKFYWKLSRRVAALARGTTFASEDPYGYIGNDGSPVLVVPVKAFTNCPHCYDVPQGDVVWSNTYSKGHFFHNVKEGELLGPVVGISVAADLRSSLGDRGGFKDAFQHKLEFQASNVSTGSAADALDPNAGNTTEFMLKRADGTGEDFVSPLSPYGSTTQISAVFVVKVGSVQAGHLPEATLYQLPTPRSSFGDAVVTITGRYGSNLQFASANTSDAINELRILEITPGPTPDRWIAWIGRDLRVSYRVEIARDLSTCIFNETGKKLRCDEVGNDPTPIPVGALIGIAGQTPTTTPGSPNGTTITPGTDLTKVPTQQLINELSQLQAEINRRAAAASH